jgi:tetratricopeptide (TPR) repeat protein
MGELIQASTRDFFVSYTQADRSWAEWIAWQLEEAGHRVLVQAWDFVPGTNWTQSMQQGVVEAVRTIAVLSPQYLESVYGQAEWLAAWGQDPEGKQRKLLVVRVQECERPGLLAGVVGVDLFGRGEGEAKAQLRRMISQALDGRAKPDQEPMFPDGHRTARRAMPRGARFPGALPSVWEVPTRNPNFTGRAEDLAKLAAGFTAGQTVTVHALHGMGGVGKTQLATEFAHRHAGDYDAVWWLNAEEMALVPEQLALLAARLGVDPRSGEPEAVREALHAGLAHTRGWLLVFDNAESTAVLRDWLPTAPLAPGVAGHALVTTRRDGFDAYGRVVDLDVLDLAESVDLLRTRVPDIGDDIAAQIAEELGRLPLALEQAAAYLNKTKMPPAQYLALFRERTQDLIGRGTVSGRGDNATIATLWDLSLSQLQDRQPAAVQLLDICAYLAPVAIPEDLFSHHPDPLPAPLDSACRDVLAFTDVVEAVVDYSLAKRTPSGLVFHRLVQAAIRARHATSETHHQIEVPADSATEITRPMSLIKIPADTQAPGLLALGLLRADAPGEVYDQPEDWPRWAVLLPHVLAVTAHIHDEVTTCGSASQCSWLLNRAGTYLQTQGRYRDAEPLLRRGLAITEQAHGPNHPDVATRLNNLATVLQDLGDAAGARPLAERALAITERTEGLDHPDVAIRLNNLALVLHDLGDATGARLLAERALTITENVHGSDHPHVATRLNNLALVRRDLGDAAGARPLAERALTITENVHGLDHPHVAICLTTLALVRRDLGDAAGARPLAERAFTITENTHGPEHPTVATSLNTLAAVLQDLGEDGAATHCRERASRVQAAGRAQGAGDNG